jgi:hypothetical protein
MEIDLKPIYWVVGTVVVANIGTIIALLVAASKGVWWLSKLDSRVDDAKDCGVRAHKRIDNLDANV